MSALPASGRGGGTAAILFMIACSEFAAAQSDPDPEAIRVAIPTAMVTENLCIEIGIYGRGLFMEGVKGRKGVYEYDVPCRVSGAVKLFAYLPGYRIAHTNNLQPGASWAPAFEKLEAVELQGILTDTRGRPLPGQHLVLTYEMVEAMRFFGYCDGSVPELFVAKAQARGDGTFQAAIPRMDQDPFLREHAMEKPERTLDINLASMGSRYDASSVLRPLAIPVQCAYPRRIAIQLVNKARLKGQLAPSFLEKNGITGEVRGGPWPENESGFRIELFANSADGRSGRNCDLKSDLTFSALLPPGTYNLKLIEWSRGYAPHKTVSVKAGLALEEGGDVTLRVE